VGQYVIEEGKEYIDEDLNTYITYSMGVAKEKLTAFSKHDFHREQPAPLKAYAIQAEKYCLPYDFHLKADTGCTSLYCNVDTRTLKRYTEKD